MHKFLRKKEAAADVASVVYSEEIPDLLDFDNTTHNHLMGHLPHSGSMSRHGTQFTFISIHP